MGLIDALGRGPIGIDTAPFITFIEENPAFVRVLDELFGRIDSGQLTACQWTRRSSPRPLSCAPRTPGFGRRTLSRSERPCSRAARLSSRMTVSFPRFPACGSSS